MHNNNKPIQRTFRDRLLLVVKGMAMGMANKIPGVSGGIVALAAGFYQELIHSFSRFDAHAFRLLFQKGFLAFYRHVNGGFLLYLFSGVGLSFFSVSLLLDVLIRHFPQHILGAFLGMILTSVYLIWKNQTPYQKRDYTALLSGLLLGIGLLWVNPGTENDHSLFVFFCGMVSIVGMTLPGLSGSLIVLILGNYNLLLVDAVNGLFYTLTDLTSGQGLGLDDPERRRLLRVFVLFTLGSSFGLVFFSKLLEKILQSYKNTTIAVLVGFILGAIGAVWPWTATSTAANENLNLLFTTPHQEFFLPHWLRPKTYVVLGCVLLGGTTVLILDHYGNKKTT